jgi:hypothetical protein
MGESAQGKQAWHTSAASGGKESAAAAADAPGFAFDIELGVGGMMALRSQRH